MSTLQLKVEEKTIWRILGLTQFVKTENIALLGGYLLPSGKTIVVDDLYVIEQSASMTHVQNNFSKVKEWLIKNPEKNSRIVGWYHSHNDIGVFFSAVDTSWISEMLDYLSFVVSIVSARIKHFPYLELQARIDVKLTHNDGKVKFLLWDGKVPVSSELITRRNVVSLMPEDVRGLVVDDMTKINPLIQTDVSSDISIGATDSSGFTDICPVCQQPVDFGGNITQCKEREGFPFAHDECCETFADCTDCVMGKRTEVPVKDLDTMIFPEPIQKVIRFGRERWLCPLCVEERGNSRCKQFKSKSSADQHIKVCVWKHKGRPPKRDVPQ